MKNRIKLFRIIEVKIAGERVLKNNFCGYFTEIGSVIYIFLGI